MYVSRDEGGQEGGRAEGESGGRGGAASGGCWRREGRRGSQWSL